MLDAFNVIVIVHNRICCCCFCFSFDLLPLALQLATYLRNPSQKLPQIPRFRYGFVAPVFFGEFFEKNSHGSPEKKVPKGKRKQRPFIQSTKFVVSQCSILDFEAWSQVFFQNLPHKRLPLAPKPPRPIVRKFAPPMFRKMKVCPFEASKLVRFDTVDGSEIRQTHPLRLVVYPSIYMIYMVLYIQVSQVVNQISSINRSFCWFLKVGTCFQTSLEMLRIVCKSCWRNSDLRHLGCKQLVFFMGETTKLPNLGFPEINKGISLTKPPFGVRWCEVRYNII